MAKKKAAKKKPAKKTAKKTTKKTAKKKPAAKKSSKKAPKEVLVVASKVKAYVKSKGCMSSKETVEALSNYVYACLDQAVARTKANRRSTVKPQDL